MTQQTSEQRIGKGMLLLFWIAILGAGTLIFNGWLDKRNNPNQQPTAYRHDGINEVILERNRHHHYLANGLLNGTEVTLMLDTGATQVSVPEHIARKIGLQPGAPVRVNTANGIVVAHTTTIDRLQLGTITWTNIPAHINPGMKSDEILLGMSALKNVEFTHRDGTLTLKQYY